ncbi:MAG TPA: RNA methyltransferase substrate-binding domain-containing protein, partial [Caldilineaceae bacterium]|nr:RNA methyltransferase substrate-binding domain-containing protein [Caldilineaceae bacterium]
VELFFLPEAAQQNPAVAALVRKLDVPAGFCQPVTREVMATLTETVTPQGVVAVLPQPRLALPGKPTLTLVLDQLR